VIKKAGGRYPTYRSWAGKCRLRFGYWDAGAVDRARTPGRRLVVHDLNHATRDGTHPIANAGRPDRCPGWPVRVVTADLVEDVFGLPCTVIPTR